MEPQCLELWSVHAICTVHSLYDCRRRLCYTLTCKTVWGLFMQSTGAWACNLYSKNPKLVKRDNQVQWIQKPKWYLKHRICLRPETRFTHAHGKVYQQLQKHVINFLIGCKHVFGANPNVCLAHKHQDQSSNPCEHEDECDSPASKYYM